MSFPIPWYWRTLGILVDISMVIHSLSDAKDQQLLQEIFISSGIQSYCNMQHYGLGSSSFYHDPQRHPTHTFVPVLKLWEKLHAETQIAGEVPTKLFILAYAELMKPFEGLGKIFQFVKSDVMEKLGVLDSLYQKEPVKFSTLQKMVQFEHDGGILTSSQAKNSGSRHLLRLLRAMQFLRKVLENVVYSNSENLKDSFKEAYDSSLAQYHPWAIRKAVGLALHYLPSRSNFLAEMGMKEQDVHECLPLGIQYVSQTKDNIWAIYDKYNLHNLP